MDPCGLPRKGHWVYLITCSATGKVYVGKTNSPYRRCHQYMYDFKFRNLGHLNDHLFNAMRKYGIDTFDMRLWDACESDDHAVERELYWIDLFNSTSRSNGYNLRRDSQRRMVTHPETSAKIRNNLKAQWRNGVRDEHGRKLRETWKNATPEKRSAQGHILRRVLTKYEYVVTRDGAVQTCDFRTLKSLGLRSILSHFSRHSIDDGVIHGCHVRRVRLCPA